MGINQIGYQGEVQLQPSINFAQNGGQQYILRTRQAVPVTLLPGQTFVLPAAQWQVVPGRYTHLQWYDTNIGRWRNYNTQPGQPSIVSSDGTNQRLANSTGCPIGALLTNVGAGNATNGYNTIGVTPSAGNSTWGTLVGGTLNQTMNITTAGNYALPPIVVWTPNGNQTLPYIAPQVNCTIASNGNITTCSMMHAGAGLTGTGTFTVIQQPGDTNPGGGVLTVAGGNLCNSGNLVAMWPLTYGQNGNVGLQSVPTFTFNIGGGLAATAIMNFTVTGLTANANAGANYGANQPYMVLSANGSIAGGNSNQPNGNQNIQILATDQGAGVAMPRMAWLTGNSNAAGNASNANVIVVDGGLNLQAIPYMVVIAGNGSGANIQNATFVPQVGGVSDTSYIQAI